MMINKYHAKGQYYDGYYFGSTLESKVYHLLKKYDDNLSIHPRLTLVDGKKPWRPIAWKPDFYSPVFNQYIEVKGTLTPEFKLKMQLLHYLNPGMIEDIWFVTRNRSYRWQGIYLMNIDEFQRHLKAQEFKLIGEHQP
ncbi:MULTISPECIES: DUF1064 domain-containing protein [Limnospira]|uniref:DUF1064 domain-containing protein n=1 Tax=Limnospira fusiformis PMC 851.14 TaxID=2219512 RepID=A0ABU9EJX2_LIMFS|nr:MULTISPECIES: DUF1064 domain-containing protein [unclassified Limnospira]EKD06672.1 hypothetical protein SPLC1_S532660 [Arthrospira platensis C1]MDT9236308.1 DUF1064 domain-containing protein [Limnospira sp. PMC 917.15]MDT9277175.1 DUF1064 domain-containing protein [Limnospira sp. PMC 737.11]